MALAFSEASVTRPSCPKHPDNKRILLDGFTRSRWSDAHRRPRYRCVTEPNSRGHAFTLPVAGCPECFRLHASDKIKAGQKRARQRREADVAAQPAPTVIPIEELTGGRPF